MHRIDFDESSSMFLANTIFNRPQTTGKGSPNDLSASEKSIILPLLGFAAKSLNENEKQIIKQKIKLIFSDISSSLTPSQAVEMLSKILSNKLMTNEIEDREAANRIKQAIDILAQPSEQNCVLTSENDGMTSIHKEAAIVDYIHELIKQEIKHYQNKAAAIMQFWYRRIRDENAPTIPDEIVCPITGQIFQDPVELPNNVIVERDAIENWIKKEGSNPFTRKRLTIDDLKPAILTLEKVKSFFEINKQSPFMHLSKYTRYKKEETSPESAPISTAQSLGSRSSDFLVMYQRFLNFSLAEEDHADNPSNQLAPIESGLPSHISYMLHQSPLYSYYLNELYNRYDPLSQSNLATYQEGMPTTTNSTGLLTNNNYNFFNRSTNSRQQGETQPEVENENSIASRFRL